MRPDYRCLSRRVRHDPRVKPRLTSTSRSPRVARRYRAAPTPSGCGRSAPSSSRSRPLAHELLPYALRRRAWRDSPPRVAHAKARSEEHTSELQSPSDLVCRLLLEQKKKTKFSTLALKNKKQKKPKKQNK